MGRLVLVLGFILGVVGSLAAADKDTPLAANTRTKKLPIKVTVEFQDQYLRECFAEISKQLDDAGAGTLSVRYDTGVSMNQRVTYKAKDETLDKVLDGM